MIDGVVGDEVARRLTRYRNPTQIAVEFPGLQISNDGFNLLLEAFPNLQRLAIDGSNLTQVDLRSSPKLDSLTLSNCNGLDRIEFDRLPPSTISISDESIGDNPTIRGSYRISGPGFDRERLQQLLDMSPDDLSITSRIEDPKSLRGLDLKGCRRVTFEQNDVSVEVMASWKFDPSVSDRSLLMNGDDPIPKGWIEQIEKTFLGLFELNWAKTPVRESGRF